FERPDPDRQASTAASLLDQLDDGTSGPRIEPDVLHVHLNRRGGMHRSQPREADGEHAPHARNCTPCLGLGNWRPGTLVGVSRAFWLLTYCGRARSMLDTRSLLSGLVDGRGLPIDRKRESAMRRLMRLTTAGVLALVALNGCGLGRPACIALSSLAGAT